MAGAVWDGLEVGDPWEEVGRLGYARRREVDALIYLMKNTDENWVPAVFSFLAVVMFKS